MCGGWEGETVGENAGHSIYRNMLATNKKETWKSVGVCVWVICMRRAMHEATDGGRGREVVTCGTGGRGQRGNYGARWNSVSTLQIRAVSPRKRPEG